MKDILFNLFIYPIIYILELIFSLVYQMIGSAGYSVIAVSIIVSIMVLPMYMRSDAMQEKERDEQKRLSHWVKHIRKTFSGDERFMILQEYYRQNHYHPLYILRGSLSMLLEVPFFIAAYYFLSHLALLQGTSFHVIRDLGAPDALISIGSISINVLPILMTLINFVSGAIYTKGFPLKDKLQLYGLAVLFLILLYDSPSGLVIYWTMNNLFSLVKNIFMKALRHPERDIPIFSAVSGIAFVLFMLKRGKLDNTQSIVFSVAVLIICFIPLIMRMMSKLKRNSKEQSAVNNAVNESLAKQERTVLILAEAFLSFLMGIVIPASIVSSSPTDFISVYNYVNPLYLIVQTFCVYCGLFLIWTNIIDRLITRNASSKISAAYWILSVLAIVNYLVFSAPRGILSTDLICIAYKPAPVSKAVLNFLGLAVAGAAAIVIYRRSRRAVIRILSIGLTAVIFLSSYYVYKTNTTLKNEYVPEEIADASVPEDGVVQLSKHGRNVIVVMLDRAISGYIPYIFDEDPSLKDKFAGFTYYPNCLSFGEHTNFGSPAIFGGYEYSPDAINHRTGMTIAQKHNEALCVLPKLFSEENYEITLCDPPYAGYKEIADFSIYDGIDNVRGLHVSGALLPDNYDEMLTLHQTYRKHSFLTYSVFATSPAAFRWWIYDNGRYRGTRRFTDGSPSEELIREYTELEGLPNISVAEDNNENHLFMMVNNLTHNPEPLQLPDYTMPVVIDNSEVQGEWLHQFDGKPIRMDEDYVGPNGFKSHYQVNAAAIHLIGEWLTWMQENDVYDNTRIILVADHGNQIGQFPDMIINEHLDVQGFNPLLLFKDFNATEFTTDNSFMTNADVPSLALKGIVEDAHNPYTGVPLNSNYKDKDQLITTSHHLGRSWGNLEQFDTSDGRWFKVHDNIFDKNNWEEVD